MNSQKQHSINIEKAAKAIFKAFRSICSGQQGRYKGGMQTANYNIKKLEIVDSISIANNVDPNLMVKILDIRCFKWHNKNKKLK